MSSCFLFHKWKGCTCTKCGATRHVYPTTSHRDGGGLHHGKCICRRCKQTNPDRGAHAFITREDCRCRICHRDLHEWMGCICTRCRTDRHTWDSCICIACGERMPDRLFPKHDWKGCKCTKCGTAREEGHIWVDNKCSYCGKIKPQRHRHQWDGCKCTTCGDWRDQGHKFVGGKCTKCGVGYTEYIVKGEIKEMKKIWDHAIKHKRKK